MGSPTIALLPSDVIDQIAAGEVIERPASVVKELVENALDAGAETVRLELKAGGLERIAVIDDGVGITEDQARLAIARHATSKLRRAEDLAAIGTLGFRGEALSSIASVSRLTLTTRPHDVDVGTRLVVHAGEVVTEERVGCPVGTSIEVESLFFNTPARRKFMRSPATEQAHAVDAAVRTLLGARRGGLVALAGERRLVDLSELATEEERVRAALGRKIDAVYGFDTTHDGVRVSGYVTAPEHDRADARGLSFFVNGRFVRDRLLQRAALEGYRSMLERGRYPVAAIFVDLAREAVDVNVHPQKLEVRFRDGSAVFRAIAAAIAEVLAATPWVGGDASPGARVRTATERFFSAPSATFAREQRVLSYAVRPEADAAPGMPVGGHGELGYFSRLLPIGQALGLYLVCEGEDEIVLIDQHAAHERITFERLRTQAARGGVERQQLLFPELLAPEAVEGAALEERLGDFDALGFEVEPLGPSRFAVRAVPAALAGAHVGRLVSDLLDELASLDGDVVGGAVRDRQDALLSRCACHTAVRAGDKLSREEIAALLAELDRVDFGAACPHGRPVYHRLGRSALDRLFHRSV